MSQMDLGLNPSSNHLVAVGPWASHLISEIYLLNEGGQNPILLSEPVKKNVHELVLVSVSTIRYKTPWGSSRSPLGAGHSTSFLLFQVGEGAGRHNPVKKIPYPCFTAKLRPSEDEPWLCQLSVRNELCFDASAGENFSNPLL